VLTREELEQIPLRYRWLLKLFLRLPTPSIPFAVLKRLPEIEGVFWTIIVPILLTLYFFFNVWLITFTARFFGFPLNIIVSFLIPGVAYVFFIRIYVKRAILWWRNVHERPREWEVPKRVEELIELFKKQQRRK